MADWPVPEGLEGDAGLLRVHATAARAGERACPQYLAAKGPPRTVAPAAHAPQAARLSAVPARPGNGAARHGRI